MNLRKHLSLCWSILSTNLCCTICCLSSCQIFVDALNKYWFFFEWLGQFEPMMISMRDHWWRRVILLLPKRILIIIIKRMPVITYWMSFLAQEPNYIRPTLERGWGAGVVCWSCSCSLYSKLFYVWMNVAEITVQIISEVVLTVNDNGNVFWKPQN